MLKNKLYALYCTGENFLKRRYPLLLAIFVLATAGVLTFVLQNTVIGFEPGYDALAPKHHGSVSSKGLAIIAQATAENGFVGFATRYKDDQNHLVYDYFDRYPVFFSATFNRILALRPKLSSKLLLAKQVMNVIFVATMLVAFLLLDKLVRNKPLALFAVLIAFSNPYLLFYKDMVHFDQPALFGFLLLTYAIALYKIDGLRWPMVAATFIAIALGRGYASYAILGLWLLIEAFLILRQRGPALGQKIRAMIKQPAFLLLVIGVIWGGGLLSYNILVEARTKHISPLETSIVDSASRRLALSPEFNEANEAIINWPEYGRDVITRVVQWTLPVKWLDPGLYGSAAILLIMLVVIGIVIRKQPPERRIVFILLAFSGFAWMIPMRNMAAPHDYTSMYFIGVPLAFFLSVLVLLKPSRDAAVYLALMALIVYLTAITGLRDFHTINAGNADDYTYDFMRIETTLGSTGNNIYMANKVPNGTNAPEFYLADQYLSTLPSADYVISADKAYAPDNLTPDNTFMFLFKAKK